MKKKILLTGGTGFICIFFQKTFLELGYDVKIISSQPLHINRNDHEAIVDVMENSEMVINLK